MKTSELEQTSALEHSNHSRAPNWYAVLGSGLLLATTAQHFHHLRKKYIGVNQVDVSSPSCFGLYPSLLRGHSCIDAQLEQAIRLLGFTSTPKEHAMMLLRFALGTKLLTSLPQGVIKSDSNLPMRGMVCLSIRNRGWYKTQQLPSENAFHETQRNVLGKLSVLALNINIQRSPNKTWPLRGPLDGYGLFDIIKSESPLVGTGEITRNELCANESQV